MIKSDITIDLLYGDNAKGKVVSHLLLQRKLFSNKPYYTHVVKYNGSSNAGHTVYINNQKYITHLFPAGVFHGIKSIIGPECLLNVEKFFTELNYLERAGFNCKDLIKIDNKVYIITKEHIEEDSKDCRIGTTKQGVGPAMISKMSRVGYTAKDVPELKPFLIDMYNEFFKKGDVNVLFEGSQGFYLDITQGDFPYCTTTHCSVGSAIMNGVPYHSIRNVYGVIKCYTTYVGAKKFQPEGEIFNNIQQLGSELGATTGRKRQCNWNDINLINKAIDINGVNILVVNKMDVLRELGVWKTYKDGEEIDLKNENGFKKFMKDNINKGVKIIFSDRKDRI